MLRPDRELGKWQFVRVGEVGEKGYTKGEPAWLYEKQKILRHLTAVRKRLKIYVESLHSSALQKAPQ